MPSGTKCCFVGLELLRYLKLIMFILQYSMFRSIITIGAMIGAITSGGIAAYIGRKVLALILKSED